MFVHLVIRPNITIIIIILIIIMADQTPPSTNTSSSVVPTRSPKSAQAGRVLARGLGIDLDHRSRTEPTAALHAAAATVPDLRQNDLFFEQEPTVAEWLHEIRPTRACTVQYIKQLFPFWTWIFHYNMTWLLGDVVAGG